MPVPLFVPQLTAMILGDTPGNTESQSSALPDRLRGEKWFHDAFAQFEWYTVTAVDHGQNKILLSWFNLDTDPSLTLDFRDRVERILKQVHENLHDLDFTTSNL
jgi:hypothetical protein